MMYRHDKESYVITIRRKGVSLVSVAPEEESFKPAQPVHKIEKPVQKPSAVTLPVLEVPAMPDSGVQAVEGKTIKSPLPGVIVAVKVNVGDKVKVGDVVAVLEAMKMENEIQSEYGGTVAAVGVSQGDSILEGAAIVTIN